MRLHHIEGISSMKPLSDTINQLITLPGFCMNRDRNDGLRTSMPFSKTVGCFAKILWLRSLSQRIPRWSKAQLLEQLIAHQVMEEETPTLAEVSCMCEREESVVSIPLLISYSLCVHAVTRHLFKSVTFSLIPTANQEARVWVEVAPT